LLAFEGIMLSGDVWLNGNKIGGTDYGYLGFESDITDIIKYDSDNVVAVRASTGENGNSRWYTGGMRREFKGHWRNRASFNL
jgi:beta-galactosidase